MPDIQAQRWHQRVEYKRLPHERAKLSTMHVAIIDDRVAKPFVVTHHYSASYPASHLAVGLFDGSPETNEPIGVAVFSEGVRSHAAMPKWTGHDRSAGTELGRFVLRPEVGYNAESWFLARAFELLAEKRPQTRAVLSYADPVERRLPDNTVIKPGHVGTIYQATNAFFLGRASPRRLYLGPDGRVIHPYNFDKIAGELRNAATSERILTDAGCPARRTGESPQDWIARVKRGLPSFRHPGNLVYAFGLSPEARKTMNRLHPKRAPYPKGRNTIQRHTTADGAANRQTCLFDS